MGAGRGGEAGGTEARLTDGTWTPRVNPKVTPGPLWSCRATRGPRRVRDGKGPALRSSCCARPRPQERREPSLPGLGEAQFKEGRYCSPLPPRRPQPPPPPPSGLRPMWPSPGRLGKALCGPSALLCLGPRTSE